MGDLLNVSSNPHIRSKVSTDKIMLCVIIALLPATAFGVINFGIYSLYVIGASVASAVITEIVCCDEKKDYGNRPFGCCDRTFARS